MEILAILWGMFDAVKDTIEHHPDNKLSRIPGWWGRWFRSDSDEWPLLLGLIRYDAKHVFKWLAYFSAILIGSGINGWDDIIISVSIAVIVFLLFYKVILVERAK